MEQILKILSTLNKDVDFAHTEGLVSNFILNSIDIVTLVTELEEEFNIEINMEYIDNKHFESIYTIYDMVREIMDNK